MTEHVWFNGNLMSLRHSEGWTFLEARLRPGHAPPLHMHRNEDEAFYLLEGSMRFRRGEDLSDLGPGDFVAVPRGVAHAFRVGEEGARTLQVATGTDLAEFIREAGVPAEEPRLPDAMPDDAEALARAAERHDMVILGPPLDAKHPL